MAYSDTQGSLGAAAKAYAGSSCLWSLWGPVFCLPRSWIRPHPWSAPAVVHLASDTLLSPTLLLSTLKDLCDDMEPTRTTQDNPPLQDPSLNDTCKVPFTGEVAKAQVLGLSTRASLEREVILSDTWTVPKMLFPKRSTRQDSWLGDARTETSIMHSEEVELDVFCVKTFLQKATSTFEAIFPMQLEPKLRG